MDPYIKNRICYVISGIILPHVLNPLFPLRTLFFSKIPLHPILSSHPLDLQKKKLLYIHSHFLLAIIFSFTSLFRFCHFFFFCHLYKPFCFTIVPAIASFLLILQHCTTNWILTSVLSTILPTYLSTAFMHHHKDIYTSSRSTSISYHLRGRPLSVPVVRLYLNNIFFLFQTTIQYSPSEFY